MWKKTSLYIHALEDFQDSILLRSPGWPQTCNPPASASKHWDYRH